MKYVVSLLLGLVVGAALFVAGLIYNPFIAARGLSPLSVTNAETITLSFANVPAESIAYTNDGESLHNPHPERVLQLWEAPIRSTSAMATVMRDARGRVAGIGVKFSSDSESTRLLKGEAIIDSAWYVYLPEHGSLFIEQTENYFPLIREVAFPAWRSSASSWRGNWLGDLTVGPGALGTAAVTGGSGRVKGLRMEGVESISVRAFSADVGLVSSEGRLIIAMHENLGGIED
jgi:Tfp pilus assembly protein PilZ